jgi:hypothetical protein
VCSSTPRAIEKPWLEKAKKKKKKKKDFGLVFVVVLFVHLF